MQTLVEQARTLSSGTIGTLIRSKSYARIDSVQRWFVFFCEKHADEFETWQEAWDAFQKLNKKENENA